MSNKKKLFQLAVSLVILTVLFFSIDLDELSKININSSIYIIFGIFGMLFLSIGTRALRWQIIYNSQAYDLKFSFWSSFRYVLIGSALNIITPAGSGDVLKSYYIFKDTGAKESAIAVSLFDKLVAIASIGFLGIYAYGQTLSPIYLSAAVISPIPLIVMEMGVLFREKSFLQAVINFIARKIKRLDFHQLLEFMSFSLKTKTVSLAISLCGWIATYILLFLCFILVGSEQLTIENALVEGSILTLGRLFPFTFSGLGSDEAIMIFLFQKYQITSAIILSGALIYRLILIFVPAMAGLVIIQKKAIGKT